ncbi:MAG: hypothetical protein AAF264_11220, partial [Pseudomonadota bacterium]
MWTPAFEAFVAPARAKPQIWRLLLGGLIIAICWGSATLGTLFAGAYLASAGGDTADTFEQALMAGTSPIGTLLILTSFTGLFAGVLLAGRLHGRGLSSLTGRRQVLPFLVGIVAILLATLLGLL